MSDSSSVDRRILPVLAPAIICVLLPVLLVLSTINRHPKFSPIDEAAHFDYVERVYSHGIPKFGDLLLRSTLRELSCRQTRLEGLVVPACDAKKPYSLYPGGAYQYEAQQPPFYYAVTAPFSSIAEKVLGIGAVGAARIFGVFWLVGALLILWRTSRILEVPRFPMLFTLLAVAASPLVVYYSSIVSNDAAGLLWGSIAALIGAMALKNRSVPAWLVVAAGAAAALTKTSCALPFGVVGLMLIARRFRSGDDLPDSVNAPERLRRLATVGLAMIAGAVAGTLAWISYYRITATIDPKKLPTFDVLRTGPVTPVTILGQAKSFLSILTDSYTPFSAWNSEAYLLLGTLVSLVVVAGLAGGVFTSARTWWSSSGPVVLTGLYLGGAIIGLGIWFSYDVNPGVSARYALPMIPLVALIVPAGIQRRRGQILYSLGCLAFSAMSLWMITHVSLA